MTQDYSRDGLLSFLKDAAMAGLINPATARSRRTAAEQLLTQLNTPEAADLRTVDVDELCARFHKLQGSTIRPEALTIYNQRLKAALTDYFRYLENPDGFSAVGGERRELRRRGSVGNRSQEERALEEIRLGVADQAANILPVPIRPDLVVYVQNLPLDLSATEARKIARVIEAMAVGEASGKQP